MATPDADATEVAVLTHDLVRRHPDASPDLVHQVVAEAFQQFANARVRTFVPLLVTRAAADRLRLLTARACPAEHPLSA